jgi:hypothetical protein
VVVRARNRHDFADAELPCPLVRYAGELGRVPDGSYCDDASLTGHQPGNRSHRSEATRIGERHGGSGKIVGHQLVAARLVDQGLVGPVERGEIHGVRPLDDRHYQAATTVLPLHVYRKTERDPFRLDPVWRAVDDRQRMAHHAMLLCGLDDGVGDEMGERDLVRSPGILERAVELAPALLEDRDRKLPEGRSGGNGEALVHVRHELGGRTLYRLGSGAVGQRGSTQRVSTQRVSGGAGQWGSNSL